MERIDAHQHHLGRFGVHHLTDVPSQQQAAEEVASELGVAKTSVQPLSSSVPVASVSGNDVVVVVGPDLAGNGFPATTASTT